MPYYNNNDPEYAIYRDQRAYEVDTNIYTTYQRQSIERSPTNPKWHIYDFTTDKVFDRNDPCINSAKLLVDITFPSMTFSQSYKTILTHFAIGTTQSGEGKILYTGILETPIKLTGTITPIIPAGTLIKEYPMRINDWQAVRREPPYSCTIFGSN